MSIDHLKHSPEAVKAAIEASEKSIAKLRKPVHYKVDTEPSEPLEPELLAVREQLPLKYQHYSDLKAGQGGENLSADKEFLEFFKDLNPNYKALFKDWVDEQQIWTPETFHKNIEFFRTNYSLFLSDQEAVQALTFLFKDKYSDIETTKKKV